MVFFANSGTTWPNLEHLTQEAGHDALDGASKLWRALALIEGRELTLTEKDEEREKLAGAASQLRNAARLYRDVESKISNGLTEKLSPAEIDLAALVNVTSHDSPFYDLFLLNYINVQKLYNEIAIRLEILASGIAFFDPGREKNELSPQVFQMMKQWDCLSTLGRVIAVLNRRPQRV